MKLRPRLLLAATTAVLLGGPALADDQTQIGGGNAVSAATARRSPLVITAMARLKAKLQTAVADSTIRAQTLDALFNPNTCIAHRVNVTDAVKDQIIAALTTQGLVNPANAAGITGGVKAGIFPAVVNDGTACPTLPMPFYAAPAGGSGSHHSYPGGLPIHESFNTSSNLTFAANYQNIYGKTNSAGLPEVAGIGASKPQSSALPLSQDILVAAPMWHDWAKPIVFQWNADGTIFAELAFGGNGTTDNYGAAGDSRTGGHHILSIAESMKRGLPPEFVIAQASAHNAPTLGGEYKVVNWLRTAAIIAQIDPVASGYLFTGSDGKLHLPPVRHLGDIDLIAAGQANVLAEYPIHNLSDADFVFSIPAVNQVDVVLKSVAGAYGYDPVNSPLNYTTKFRNVALSYMSAERLQIIYANFGIPGVETELNKLKSRRII